jgi:serine/threonine-protein kinase RsbW
MSEYVVDSIEVDEEVVIQTAEVRAAVDRLLHRISRMGYTVQFLFCVTLALEEAVANAVRHGNRNDPKKQVRLRLVASRDGVQVEVEDEGDGFDADSVPDPLSEDGLVRPSGRGILLMRSFMDAVAFHQQGTLVSMNKRFRPVCPPRPALLDELPRLCDVTARDESKHGVVFHAAPRHSG